MKTYLGLFASAAALAAAPASAVTFVNNLQVANGTDLSGLPHGVNSDRLGGLGSDLFYDAATGTYFGMTDRGPGGGTIDYAPRIQQFSVKTDAITGAISNFTLVNTILFKDAGGSTFSGLNPLALNGSVSTLGRSFDPEGLVRMKNGNFLVSDEYGPSVYEFDATGQFIRAFQTPDNLIPRRPDGSVDYLNGRGTITTGRQDNRGFEGLTLSPDGTKAFAVLQDPLANEGGSSEGRRGRNVRIVQFDVASGTAEKQVIYQLESVADINARIPGTADDFGATAQGRNIGVSAIYALPDGHHFLVLERDNRGLGVDPSVANLPVGSKRVFLIDINGATDVSSISLAGLSSLPSGVTPVSKSLFLDIQAALKAAGLPIPEKIEGLSFGQFLADGGLSLVLATDNDFSVTQDPLSLAQSDICTDFKGGFSTIALDSACPTGFGLIPNNFYSFRISHDEALALGLVPEPASWAMMIAGFGIVGVALRRRRQRVAFA